MFAGPLSQGVALTVGKLCHKCHTQEVFDGSHLSGKTEGSLTGVQGSLIVNVLSSFFLRTMKEKENTII